MRLIMVNGLKKRKWKNVIRMIKKSKAYIFLMQSFVSHNKDYLKMKMI